MKSLILVSLALFIATPALSQTDGRTQDPGRRGPDRERADRRGRDFNRCGYSPEGRDHWKDLGEQIQDIIRDAQDIQQIAHQRFAAAQSSTFGDGRVVDAYLSVGALLGLAQATLGLTRADDWNNWERFTSASDRLNVSQAVETLQRAASAIRNNDQFGIYRRGRNGLGQRLDCDIFDLRAIANGLTDRWRQGRPESPSQPPLHEQGGLPEDRQQACVGQVTNEYGTDAYGRSTGGIPEPGRLARGSQIQLLSRTLGARPFDHLQIPMAQVRVIRPGDSGGRELQGKTVWVTIWDTDLRARCELR